MECLPEMRTIFVFSVADERAQREVLLVKFETAKIAGTVGSAYQQGFE
jgi:hypothetical protein